MWPDLTRSCTIRARVRTMVTRSGPIGLRDDPIYARLFTMAAIRIKVRHANHESFSFVVKSEAIGLLACAFGGHA